MKRHTPLKADPAKVRAWRRRTAKALPRVSAKQRIRDCEYAQDRADTLREAGWLCQARLTGCLVWASETHHKAGRIGPDAAKKLLAVCRECHRRITEHPAEAYALGLSEKRVA